MARFSLCLASSSDLPPSVLFDSRCATLDALVADLTQQHSIVGELVELPPDEPIRRCPCAISADIVEAVFFVAL